MRAFWILCAAGIALRAAALWALDGYVSPYDPRSYMELARGLIESGEYGIDNAFFGRLEAGYPPLYPLLLAAAGALFGVNLATVTLLNALLDVGTAYAIYLLAGRRLLAPAIFLLWPTLILYSAVAQKESLSILLVAWLPLLRDRPAMFGALTGALALAQPALLPFPIILAAVTRIGWRRAAVAGAVALALLVPWIVRNWLLFGQFVPLTTTFGFSLAHVVHGEHLPLAPELLALPEPLRSAEVGRGALAAIGADPLAYVQAAAGQVWTAMVTDNFGFAWAGGRDPTIVRVLRALHLGLLVAAGVGLLRSRDLARIAIACALTVAAAMWLEFGQRHRYFLYPFLAVAASRASRISASKS